MSVVLKCLSKKNQPPVLLMLFVVCSSTDGKEDSGELDFSGLLKKR